MKRFYTAVTIAADRAILLDGRPVRTPARALLRLPSDALAAAVAGEWAAQTDVIDPHGMRLTGLANAAIDHVVPDPEGFAIPLARYGETDLLCYRAAAPASLVTRQTALWDPLLDWARQRYDIVFAVATGVVPVAQPAATIARLATALAARDAFALAGLAPLVTIGGSLVAALALAEGAIDEGVAWAATQLDEAWQVEHWGDDPLALAARDARRTDFAAATRFLDLAARGGT